MQFTSTPYIHTVVRIDSQSGEGSRNVLTWPPKRGGNLMERNLGDECRAYRLYMVRQPISTGAVMGVQ